MYTLIIDNHTTNHDTLRDLILFLEAQGLTTGEITGLLRDGSIEVAGRYYSVQRIDGD